MPDTGNQFDIVRTIRQYVPLKRAGKYFLGTCPFHEEASPSFLVYPPLGVDDGPGGTFRCFGCDRSGDLGGFLSLIIAQGGPTDTFSPAELSQSGPPSLI